MTGFGGYKSIFLIIVGVTLTLCMAMGYYYWAGDFVAIIPLGNTGDKSVGPVFTDYQELDYLVPNVVHFVRFGQPLVTFVEMLCIKAALQNLRPKKLYIHCDERPSGEFWEHLVSNRSDNVIEIVFQKRPTQIFGRSIKVVQHASDVARLQILMEQGGIYLDNDVYVIKSFNEFRNYTFTVGWPSKDAYIGNQILIGTRNAPFLLKYYDTYHQFDDSQWYYNAGELPTKAILWKDPNIAHCVPDSVFGVSVPLIYQIFQNKVKWHQWHAVHLLYQHRSYLTKNDPIKEHNPENIKKLDTTFGQMARLMYYGTEEFID